MNKKSLSIGIYGIQDINDSKYPGYVHDHGICIMQNGEIVDNLHLERITRKKFDNTIFNYIYDLLKSKKLLNTNNQIAFVDNVIGRSFISKQGNIRFEAPLNQKLESTIETGRLFWLDKHEKAFILNHELAHIYSCLPFFGDFKKESLLVHFDGGASRSNFSVWKPMNDQIELVDYHWNLKYLSSLFNANALSFGIIGAGIKDQNSVPGKLMGLASFGNYNKEIEDWLIKNQYFENIWKSKSEFLKKAKQDFNYDLNHIDQKDPFIQDIIATMHEIFVRDTLKELKKYKNITNAKYLYFTGGSALNIKLNTRILNELDFEDVFIPPCTNDSGLAIGAAAHLEKINGNTVKIHSPYQNNWGLSEKTKYSHSSIPEVAKLLMNEKIIGICNEFGEVGPRALGNRSILALANSKKLAQKVSMDIKKREWYRPIAPIILKHNMQYFTGKENIHHLSKFMLLDFDIPEEKIAEIEGVTHIDKTSRIQVLFEKNENKYVWDLLSYLEKQYQVKALINTSFNVQGEPIVHTPENAMSSAKNMNLDAVVINGELHTL